MAPRLDKNYVHEYNAATHLKITNVNGKTEEFSYQLLTTSLKICIPNSECYFDVWHNRLKA